MSNSKIKMTTWLSVAIFFIALDRLFKMLAVKGYFDTSLNLLKEFITLHYSKNYYIAFSIPISGWWLNMFIILIILGLIYYLLSFETNLRNYMNSGLLLFIIFGAISNLVDRLKFGYVIDYIDIKYFTVFNLADIMIVVGCSVIVLPALLKKNK
jgi:signal peptidase II